MWAWLLVGLAAGIVLTLIAVALVGRRWAAARRAAERRARAAERLAEIGSMSAGLAHEIKNPLSTIGLNAQLLEETLAEREHDEDSRRRMRNRVGALRREVDRLTGILGDFLGFAGEVRPDRTDADLNVVVDELADFFMPEAERAGVRLRVEPSPGPIELTIDVRMIKQALLNLMLNATQAMSASDGPEAKELILRTRQRKGPRGAELAVAHVIDTGPGLTDDARERLFEPYFSTKPSGSGLGLPTSRRLVEAHGGSIEVHSEPGRGTDFAIELPMRPPNPV